MATRKLVAYFRVSTDRQGTQSLGIDAQRAAVAAYAQHTEIIGEYCEAESGKRKDRPELAKAVAHARRARAVLVIAKLDRLARNVAFVSALMESDVEFVCCDNPTANRLTLHILAAVAEDEAHRISQRTREALAAAKRRGVLLGTRDPRCTLLGTEAARRGGRKGAESNRQAAVASDAAVAGVVLQLQREGISLREIAAQLNHGGHATRTGRDWSARQVQRVLERAIG